MPKVKVVKWDLKPTSSAECHIKFTLALAFKYKYREHSDHHERVEASATVPRMSRWLETQRVVEAAILTTLRSLYLPHLVPIEARMTASSAAGSGLGISLGYEPICEDLTVVLWVKYNCSGFVILELPNELAVKLWLEDGPAYWAVRDKYKVEPDTVTSNLCSICLDYFDGGEAALMPCKHVFHGACVSRWLAGDEGHGCPTCYQQVQKVYHYCTLCDGGVFGDE